MLRYCGETLIQEKLQTIVVDVDDEDTTPKVRVPMLDRVNQTDKLSFVRSECMTRLNRFTEECDRTCALV